MRSAQQLISFGGLALVIAVGCGGSGRNGFDGDGEGNPAGGEDDLNSGQFGGDPALNIVLDPKNTTVIIDSATTPTTAGSVAYKVTQNGKDLTGDATFKLKDPSLGSFNGATFTSIASLPEGVLGKSTTVEAKTPNGQGLGTLTVVQLRKTGAQRDFFFIVPHNEAPSPNNDVLKFSTNIKQADVAFVMDTTGSMGTSINNLKTAIQGTLMTQLQAAIPNVGLAVVDYRDFGDAWVALVRQRVTTTLSLAQSAVNAMTAFGGGDTPEAAVAAMHYTLTGQANPPIAAHTPSTPGLFGAAEFRPGSVPVVVNITDAPWHTPSGNQSVATLTTAFNTTKAKFVQVSNGAPEAQADALSDATASNVPPTAFGPSCAAGMCCTGLSGAARTPTGPGGTCRLNFLSSGGNGVSTGIVQAIQAIAVGTVFDVKASASNDPKNPKGVDATKFIKALRAMDEGNPAQGCPAAPAKDSDGDGIKDTFLSVKAGTPVCFEIIPAMNTIVPPELDPQFFNAFVDVIGVQGNLPLDKRSVLFLVPPKDAGVK
ncbi:MAG: VWA domain-containing protein [Labilithrix sp.]|nr:VWA domain-containing protein [Labilithrix sp.]